LIKALDDSGIPLSLYIHVPWCVKKCPYCDFNSHAVKGELPEKAYLAALLIDLEYELSQDSRLIHTIFWGGGTPSLLSPETVNEVMAYLHQSKRLAADCEVTLEANPATLESQKWHGFFQAGINRLSVGVQTFEPERLKQIGRVHSSEQAIATIEMAHKVGFQRINLDLMFGLPGQTVAQASADIQQALSLQPHHISYYQLTIEPNTLFYQQRPTLPEDELIWDMYESGQAQLEKQGYQQYEVSAYAQKGQACRHNLNYWLFGDYMAVGPGAHGKRTEQGICRYSKPRHPQAYIDAMTAGEVPALQASDAVLSEFMMNALRVKAGFDPHLLFSRAGVSFAEFEKLAEEACKKSLLQVSPQRIKPTPQGWRHLNELMLCFFA
jgi:putative oxygen-independent coproporphyrinogen III oxidase